MLHSLVYQQRDLRTVLIIEGSHLGDARLRADVETQGLDDHFVEATSSTGPRRSESPKMRSDA
jgi:hypothetical protein